MTETITYSDGSPAVNVHYDIQNISGAATSIRAGVLADLFVGNNDSGNGVISNVAPRFVGGRDEASGLVYGLQEITPWAALQESDFEFVFDNFSATGLNNTVDSAAPDNGVGVEFRLDNIGPGEVRGIDVRWLLAAPAPPGTVSPGADGQGGVLPPPVAGKTVNAGVRQGRVFYRVPPSKKFIELKNGKQLPVGAIFDTTRGRVNLTVADGKGGTSLRVVLRRHLQVRPDPGWADEPDDDRDAQLSEGQAGVDIGGQEEEVAQAVGSGQRQLPHHRPVQLGDRPRHALAGDRPLRPHRDPGHRGDGGGA